VVLPRTEIERAGEAANMPLVRELFADRAYEDDAQLMSRSKPGISLCRRGMFLSTSGMSLRSPAATGESACGVNRLAAAMSVHH